MTQRKGNILAFPNFSDTFVSIFVDTNELFRESECQKETQQDIDQRRDYSGQWCGVYRGESETDSSPDSDDNNFISAVSLTIQGIAQKTVTSYS